MLVELDKAPDVAAIYRRAITRALPIPGRGGLGFGRRDDRPNTLPDTVLVLRNVTASRAKLAAYDRVCGFGLTDTLPPTYPHVLAFPLAMKLMSDDDFPFPMVGLVHVANRIEVLRPIDAAETLTLRVHAEGLREHPRGRQCDLVAEALVGDEVVWRGVSSYLRRESKTAGDSGSERANPPAANAQWRLTPRTGTDYADVSGDRNPIHTSAIGARLLGFRRPIAHGMWTKAHCLAALTGRLPAAYVAEVEFKAPILLPATVAFASVPDGDGWRIAVYDPQSGRPHLRGAILPS